MFLLIQIYYIYLLQQRPIKQVLLGSKPFRSAQDLTEAWGTPIFSLTTHYSLLHRGHMPEYNYSPLFLKANEALVRQLVDLAREQGTAEATFDTPEQARSYRNLVLNLKRSLGMNHPEQAYVHNSLSTSVHMRDGKWIIRVGPRRIAERGRPPDRLVSIATLGELVITEEITAESWVEIGSKLAAAKVNQDVRRVIIQHPPEPAGIEFIADKLKPEFDLVTTKPRMVLERPSARRLE